jgi:hypothetical protein
LAVLPSDAPVSTDSHVVCSVPLFEQAEPFHEEPDPVHALTEARWIVPSCWWPDEGLSTVNEIVLVVPGYSVLALLPWIVSAELVPTVAVPVPEPLVVT